MLQIIPLDRDTTFLEKEFSYKKSFPDSFSRAQELKRAEEVFLNQGFLESTFDSLVYDSLSLHAFPFIGKKWEWAKIENGNVDPILLDRIGFKEKLYQHRPIIAGDVSRLLNGILSYCENNGYPFASVKLDSFMSDENMLNAKIFLTKGRGVIIDSLHLQGDAKISKVYLENYLGIKTPALYREDVLDDVPDRLRELPFLSEEKVFTVLFNGNHATVNLFLKKKNASRFDFVLGILPNSNSTGKLLVTGDGQLALANQLGKGEALNFHVTQLPGQTVQAVASINYPYLFRLPFALDFNFNLYKQDTTYLDVKEQYGISYLLKGSDYLKAYFKNASTSLLSIDTDAIILSKTLPAYIDLNTKSYGVDYRFERVDYRFNPSHGLALTLNGDIGNRVIRKNNVITGLSDPADPTFDYNSLYDSLDLKELQVSFKFQLDKYWQLSLHSIIQTSVKAQALICNQYFQNELFRLGGFSLLRGFNEQSISASDFGLATIEYHYLLSKNSFFYLFFDQAYLENRFNSPLTSDNPFGFGAGLNFETKAGIFGVSYALGRQQSNPIALRSAKIHFGYINYF